MAKKATKNADAVSGSEKVRRYYAANPKAKQSDIAKATGVNPSQVSSVLKKLKGGKKAAKKKAAMSNGHTNLDLLMDWLKTAKDLGIDKAIDLLKSIKSN